MPGFKNKLKNRNWLVTIVATIAIVVAGWWLYSKGLPEPRQQSSSAIRGGFRAGMGTSTPVRVAVTNIHEIKYTIRSIGTVTPIKTVTVRSRVDGELLEVLFKEGAKVKKGDVLALIDPKSFQIQLDQAMGQLAQTKAQLVNAEQDLSRYRQLHQQNSISKQQLDTQLALVNQLKANIQSGQAAVDNAKLQLEYTEIKAPISGRVGLRLADPGNLISSGSAEGLAVITQVDPVSVVFSVPQADLPIIHEAINKQSQLPADVLASDDTSLIGTATLVAVDNQIESSTGTVKLRASLPNSNEALFPNQFVNVRLHVDSQKLLAIPSAAVQYGSSGAFVYVVDQESLVKLQNIETGQTYNNMVAVLAGLEKGDRVVIEGADRLRDGSKVEVITDDKQQE